MADPQETPLSIARGVLGAFGKRAQAVSVGGLDPMAGWNRIAIQLHPMMPAKDFDALRARYFYQEIAPTLPEGTSSFAALQEFRARTERPQIVSPIVSGIGQVASSFMRGALPGPRSEQAFKFVGDVAAADGTETPILNRLAEGAGSLGSQIALAETAGVALGPTVAAMTQGMKGSRFIQKAALGGVPFGVYDAATAEDGDRARAGIVGAIFGTVLGPAADSKSLLSMTRKAFNPFVDAADATAYAASLRYNELEQAAWLKSLKGPTVRTSADIDRLAAEATAKEIPGIVAKAKTEGLLAGEGLAGQPERLLPGMPSAAEEVGLARGTGGQMRRQFIAPGQVMSGQAIQALGADVEAARWSGFPLGVPEVRAGMGGTALVVLKDGRVVNIGADATNAMATISAHLDRGGAIDRFVVGPKALARTREFMVSLVDRMEDRYGGVPFYSRSTADEAAVEGLAAKGHSVFSEGEIPQQARGGGKPNKDALAELMRLHDKVKHSPLMEVMQNEYLKAAPSEELVRRYGIAEYRRSTGLFGQMKDFLRGTDSGEAVLARVERFQERAQQAASAGRYDDANAYLDSALSEVHRFAEGGGEIPQQAKRYIIGDSPEEAVAAFKRSQDVLRPKFLNDVSEQAYRAGQIRNMIRMSGAKVGPPVPRELHTELHHILGDLTEQFGIPDRSQAGQLALRYFRQAAGDKAPVDAKILFEGYMKKAEIGERAPLGYDKRRRLKGMTSGPTPLRTIIEAWEYFAQHVKDSVKITEGPTGPAAMVSTEEMGRIVGKEGRAPYGITLRGIPGGTLELSRPGADVGTWFHEHWHSGLYWANIPQDMMLRITEHTPYNFVTRPLFDALDKIGYAENSVAHKAEEAFVHAADARYMYDLGDTTKWEDMIERVAQHSRIPNEKAEKLLEGWLSASSERALAASKLSPDSVPLRNFQQFLEDMIRRTGSPVDGIQKRAQELGLSATYYPVTDHWELTGGGKNRVFKSIAGVWEALRKDGRELMPDLLGQAIEILQDMVKNVPKGKP